MKASSVIINKHSKHSRLAKHMGAQFKDGCQNVKTYAVLAI